MENLAHLFSMDMVMVTLRMAIPLILASIGSVICERSGIINLGIEGMMLMGAIGAVMGTAFTSVPWLGVALAIIMGGLFGLLHARSRFCTSCSWRKWFCGTGSRNQYG